MTTRMVPAPAHQMPPRHAFAAGCGADAPQHGGDSGCKCYRGRPQVDRVVEIFVFGPSECVGTGLCQSALVSRTARNARNRDYEQCAVDRGLTSQLCAEILVGYVVEHVERSECAR